MAAKKTQKSEQVREKRLLQIIEHAYNNAPAIKEKFDKSGVKPSDIKSSAGLGKLPFITKDEIITAQKQNPPFGGFLAVPVHELIKICVSPGPIYVPITEPNLKKYGGNNPGIHKGDIILNSFSSMASAAHGADIWAKIAGGTVLPMGVGNTELQVRTMHDLKATVYFGTPSFLMNLINKAQEIGLSFPEDFALRLAILSAEMCPPSFKKSLEETYGIAARETYGGADVGGVATECEVKSGMHINDDLFLEIVDTNTRKPVKQGESGEVVITPFNEAYPLVRYCMGDISTLATEPCPCGMESPRITRIMGRVGEAVKVRGLFLQPKEVAAVLSRFPEIVRQQCVITREGSRDNIELRVECHGQLNESMLTQSVMTCFQEVCRLKVDTITYLPEGSFPEKLKAIVDERKWE